MTILQDFTLALVQMKVTAEKAANWATAERLISMAKSKYSADVIVLPECFNSPYGLDFFRPYAEAIPDVHTRIQDIDKTASPTTLFLSTLAKRLGVYLVGGSIPESHQSALYNTCTVFDRSGTILAKHRKIHLFDIQNVGASKLTFQESKVLSPGSSFTVFDTEFGKMSVAICYDIRFPRIVEHARKEECGIVIFPAAFNTTTGPLHWTLLQRARAIDNQLYIAAASPAINSDPSNPSKYPVYGHSSIVDPWGKVLKEAGTDEEIVTATITLESLTSVRDQIPILKQQRTDLY